MPKSIENNQYIPAIHDPNHKFKGEVIAYIANQPDSRPARFNSLYQAFANIVILSHVPIMDSEIRKFADSLAKHDLETVESIILLVGNREKISLAGLKELVHFLNPNFAEADSERQAAKARLESLVQRAEELIDEEQFNQKAVENFLKEIAQDEEKTKTLLLHLASIGEGILFDTFKYFCHQAFKNRPQNIRSTDATNVVLTDTHSASV